MTRHKWHNVTFNAMVLFESTQLTFDIRCFSLFRFPLRTVSPQCRRVSELIAIGTLPKTAVTSSST